MPDLITILDIDDAERRERRLWMGYTLPDGRPPIVLLDPTERGTELAAAILHGVPDVLARASVRSRKDVPLAAVAFRSSTFETTVRVRQTGWLPGDRFALPGDDETVDMVGVSGFPGAKLFDLRAEPEWALTCAGAETLLDLCDAAPTEVVAVIVGTIFAGPIYRRSDHLGARGFVALVVARSQVGKTLLTRLLYCLMGRFHAQPGAVH